MSSQQPFQAWQSQQWNYQQQEEPMQQQQHQHRLFPGQRGEQKPNEVIMPMQSEHELSRQNSVQDMLG
ncbi:8125_t:CDS:1, partial [Paraglomus brasilianum]